MPLDVDRLLFRHDLFSPPFSFFLSFSPTPNRGTNKADLLVGATTAMSFPSPPSNLFPPLFFSFFPFTGIAVDGRADQGETARMDLHRGHDPSFLLGAFFFFFFFPLPATIRPPSGLRKRGNSFASPPFFFLASLFFPPPSPCQSRQIERAPLIRTAMASLHAQAFSLFLPFFFGPTNRASNKKHWRLVPSSSSFLPTPSFFFFSSYDGTRRPSTYLGDAPSIFLDRPLFFPSSLSRFIIGQGCPLPFFTVDFFSLPVLSQIGANSSVCKPGLLLWLFSPHFMTFFFFLPPFPYPRSQETSKDMVAGEAFLLSPIPRQPAVQIAHGWASHRARRPLIWGFLFPPLLFFLPGGKIMSQRTNRPPILAPFRGFFFSLSPLRLGRGFSSFPITSKGN